jgi:hypothetical protein
MAEAHEVTVAIDKQARETVGRCSCGYHCSHPRSSVVRRTMGEHVESAGLRHRTTGITAETYLGYRTGCSCGFSFHSRDRSQVRRATRDHLEFAGVGRVRRRAETLVDVLGAMLGGVYLALLLGATALVILLVVLSAVVGEG